MHADNLGGGCMQPLIFEVKCRKQLIDLEDDISANLYLIGQLIPNGANLSLIFMYLLFNCQVYVSIYICNVKPSTIRSDLGMMIW